MGRIGDFGWWLREHAGGVALVLALLGCGAGAVGIVFAVDAQDTADGNAQAIEELAELTAAPPPVVPTGTSDTQTQATVDELNERVAQIEESVSQLRTEASGGETTTPEETGETPDIPEVPELPEDLPDIPGVGTPETEEAPKP